MMKSLVSPTYGPPAGYVVQDIPKPTISRTDDILIKVHAASLNPVDVKGAAGAVKFFQKAKFPYRLGYDVSGTIEGVGSDVPLNLKPGVQVYALVSDEYRGTISEYCIVPAHATVQKPATLSHIEAASLPLASLTALQAFQRAETALDGGLQGKTVLIPGGLSGVGAAAVQMAKSVFHAGHVITTLSSQKVSRVEELLGKDIIDQVVEYTKEDASKVVRPRSVDYMFDTMNQALQCLDLMKEGGVIISISGIPFGEDLKIAVPDMPGYLTKGLGAYGCYVRWRVGRVRVRYESLMVKQKAKDLIRVRELVDRNLLKPIIGRTVRLDDIDAVREASCAIYNGKGGVGKFVIEI